MDYYGDYWLILLLQLTKAEARPIPCAAAVINTTLFSSLPCLKVLARFTGGGSLDAIFTQNFLERLDRLIQ